ncbi:MAG: M23 family metallopeptidase [Elusimicrobia bacterium]|nr:M23 family metallopeptidase [Elusimicrobiota bacterium]
MMIKAVFALVFLAASARAAVIASGAPEAVAFQRFSVLTPSGPDEPRPEILAKSRRLMYAEHRVQKGEGWIGNLAKDYGSNLSSLQATNNNEFVLMYPGMRMTVFNGDGLLYEVRKASETLDGIVSRYKAGAEERRKFKESIVRANNFPGVALLEPFGFERGDRVLLPGIRIAFDTYRFPFASQAPPRISSRFGSRYHPILKRRRMHDGIDIPKPYGTPVYPTLSGRVIDAGWNEGYGQVVIIKHANGGSARYGHLSKILVRVGDMVQRGKTMIGRVGSTGISTGPHLHFEVRDKNGKAINPTTKIGKR